VKALVLAMVAGTALAARDLLGERRRQNYRPRQRAFSDGRLETRGRHPRTRRVLGSRCPGAETPSRTMWRRPDRVSTKPTPVYSSVTVTAGMINHEAGAHPAVKSLV